MVTSSNSKEIKKSTEIKKSGGPRLGAGRPKGARNKKTQEFIAKIEAQGITPLEYMLSVMRDSGVDQKRRDAMAAAAAPYVHAKLQNIEMNASVTTHEATLDDLE